MEPEPALGDDAHDLLYANIARVALLQGAAWPEAAVVDGEDEGFPEGRVGCIERAVQEDAGGVGRRGHSACPAGCSRWALTARTALLAWARVIVPRMGGRRIFLTFRRSTFPCLPADTPAPGLAA